MASEAVEQRRGELLVATEDLRPLGECQVGGDENAASLVARCDHVEQQLAAGAIERDEANLVEDQHVDAVESSLCASELASTTRLDEGAHEVGARANATRRR